MNNQTHPFTLIRFAVLIVLALAIWSPVEAQSAQPTDGKMIAEGKMMEGCREMKKKKESMMADAKIQDAELTTQVAKMNSAPDNEKLGLMAALVTHMAEQRVTMDVRKAKMDGEMMQHMMQHMQMGADSMSQCPMMKGMADMDAPSDDAHKEHHSDQK